LNLEKELIFWGLTDFPIEKVHLDSRVDKFFEEQDADRA
jgi:hypothetical protein